MNLVVIPENIKGDKGKLEEYFLSENRRVIFIKYEESNNIKDKILQENPDSIFLIGNHDILPFFELKNPAKGDGDDIVYSDNPYASTDDDYYIPEKIIGRLPFNNVDDVIEYLNRRDIVKKDKKLIYGCSASVWKMASFNVVGHIDMNCNMEISPPSEAKSHKDRINDFIYLYYNLHGSSKSPYWFGQSDDGNDYPVVVAPFTIEGGKGSILATEACYGAYTVDKNFSNSLSLMFLKKGVSIFVGSTCIAYGPFSPPESEADLLVELFLLYSTKNGITGGKAFLDAKKMFARHNLWINGYLDADDKKTLIEFVYYGDPLIITGGN